MSDQNKSPFFKALIMIAIILLMPFLVTKISQMIKNEGKIEKINLDDEEKVEKIIDRYLANHQDKILSIVMNSYHEKYLKESNSEKLVNAIILYHKILFNEKLPRIASQTKDAMNMMMFFSDFDSVVPMLEKIDEMSQKSQINIYFRQIITQNKFSSVIARYGHAVFNINPELFIPYYLSILKISKKDLSEEKIFEVIKNYDLDLTQIQNIANSDEVEALVKENNDLAKRLGVSQLPAWIMENGRMVFGLGGFEIVKNLMNETSEIQ
jgi:predicted DsbA family dithiol-disulfide isomerase